MDVGTTRVKAFLYNSSAQVVASVNHSMQLFYPSRDRVEIKPDVLWETFVAVVREVLHSQE